MSHITHIDIQTSDSLSDLDAAVDLARPFLAEQGFYAVDDVLEDLKKAIEEGTVESKGLSAHNIEGVMSPVSSGHPTVTFYVRGMGEEFGDVWLRQFRAGKATRSVGPFEDEQDDE